MLISPTGFKYWVPALAEALGVMMYTFLACAAVVASPLASAQSADAASGTSNDCCVVSRSYLLTARVGADVVAIAIAHGVAYAICVAATLNLRSGVTVIDFKHKHSTVFPRSGGHINPATTLAVFLCGRIEFGKAVFYMVAQLTGAIVGASLLRVCAVDCSDVQSHNTQPWHVSTDHLPNDCGLCAVYWALWLPRYQPRCMSMSRLLSTNLVITRLFLSDY
jgi:glycerol uptake facilitator-like aquaporin